MFCVSKMMAMKFLCLDHHTKTTHCNCIHMNIIIFILQANNENMNGNYERAKSYANFSLCCNVVVYIQFLVAFILSAIVVALLLTVGLEFIGLDVHKIN